MHINRKYFILIEIVNFSKTISFEWQFGYMSSIKLLFVDRIIII